MREISQENLYLLLPHKAAGVASQIAAKEQVSGKEALLKFYRSPLYRQLENETTKLWHYSPAQLYELGFRRKRQMVSHRRNGPGHSMLLPHETWILNAWRQHKSAREIAMELEKKGIRTSVSNIWKFIRTRLKR